MAKPSRTELCCWLAAVLGLSGAFACTATTPGGSPESKPATRASRPPPTRPPMDAVTRSGGAWFVLDWSQSIGQAQQALEKAGVKVAAKSFHKTGAGYLTFKRNAMKGTVYFDSRGRMTSVLLQRSGPWDAGVVKRARRRLVQRFGKAATRHTVVRRRWRNPRTTLTVTNIPTAPRPGLSLLCVADRNPRGTLRPGGFAKVRGFSTLVWRLKPKAAAAAAKRLGYTARIITRHRRPPAPNAYVRSQSSPTYRIVELSRPDGRGELAFDAREGLTQISLQMTFPTRAAEQQRLAELSTRYGPAHTVVRTDTTGWKKGKTRANLAVTTRKPAGKMDLSERYVPNR